MFRWGLGKILVSCWPVTSFSKSCDQNAKSLLFLFIYQHDAQIASFEHFPQCLN